MRRSKNIKLRVSADELSRLRAEAQSGGMTLSELLRGRSAGLADHQPTPDLEPLLTLVRIENHLQSVARACQDARPAVQLLDVTARLLAVDRDLKTLSNRLVC